MIGDVKDMVARLRAVLPRRWFADDKAPAPIGNGASDAPVLAALLTGSATAWSWLHGMIHYVRLQTSIHTATDDFLDRTSLAFFCTGSPPRINEGAATFRARILAELPPPRAPRPAIPQALVNLPGRAPIIFEPP